MCTIPIATAVIAVASTTASIAGQRRQAKQQAQFQRRSAKAEQERAKQEKLSLRLKEGQEEVARKTEEGKIEQQTREAMATATVSAGEAGVAGLSVDALLDDYLRQQAQYNAILKQQGEWDSVQSGLALTDAGFRSQNRLIDIDRPIRKNSGAADALNVAGSGLRGYRSGLELQKAIDEA